MYCPVRLPDMSYTNGFNYAFLGSTVSQSVPALARGYGTKITRTLFPRHYRLRPNIQTETNSSALQDGSLFIRRPTAGPTNSILSSQNPSPASVSSRLQGSTTSTPLNHPDLPPALNAHKAATRPQFDTLTPEQIEEMRALRLENPIKYTRSYLAKKYNVSDMFVKCYVPTSKEIQIARIKAQKRSFDSKGWKAQEIVVQRQKRRELW
ncbi:mitochondrial ribosomal protein subunit L20-domain-containing protein [Mortierella sp. GBAus27b]|nr:mitochondrial ribosomal protein subunit L20-domain-containing protein [Mortierella sp. GBAus27b]